MRAEQDWSLYDLWRLASRKGYSLRLEGGYIRLVPLRTPGDNGQARSFTWTNLGIKSARAWLETPKALHQGTDAGRRWQHERDGSGSD